MADHLKMSYGYTAKCFSAVESLATRYAAVASRMDAWDHWYSTPAEPVTVVLPPPSAPPPVSDPEEAAPTTPKGEEHPTEPTAPWATEEENSSSSGNMHPLTKNVFTSPGKPSYTLPHPTDTCTVSPVKVAPSASGDALPTMAPRAYHPYQMPMVQNSYTKAMEDSDMP